MAPGAPWPWCGVRGGARARRPECHGRHVFHSGAPRRHGGGEDAAACAAAERHRALRDRRVVWGDCEVPYGAGGSRETTLPGALPPRGRRRGSVRRACVGRRDCSTLPSLGAKRVPTLTLHMRSLRVAANVVSSKAAFSFAIVLGRLRRILRVIYLTVLVIRRLTNLATIRIRGIRRVFSLTCVILGTIRMFILITCASSSSEQRFDHSSSPIPPPATRRRTTMTCPATRRRDAAP